MRIKEIFIREKKQRSPSMRETGVSGDKVLESFTNEEKRADKISIKDYRAMLDTDATVEALYNILTLPILAATYSIKADENDKAEEQADFVRNNLLEPYHKGGMETPIALFLEQLMMAIPDGFSLFERVMRIDDDGKMSIKKLAYRDSPTITLIADDHGGYAGARQQAKYGDRDIDVTFQAHNTFLFTYGKSRNFLYGRSAFRSLWRNYDKKKKVEYFDTVAIQAGARKPLALMRTGDNNVKNKSNVIRRVLNNLNKLGELRSAVAIPFGYDIKTIDVSGRDPDTSIERQNSEMARKFLAAFMLLGNQGSNSTGSYALSANQSDLFMISLRGLMNIIADHINQYLIADLIDLNYPASKRHYPYFAFDDLTSDTVEIIRNAFTSFIQKDKISDDMARGIEENMANKLNIDLAKIRNERKKENPEPNNDGEEDDGGDATVFPERPDSPPDVPDPVPPEPEIEEDSHNHTGHSHSKTERRVLTVHEKNVKFDKIDAWMDDKTGAFVEEATPMLENLVLEVAENPENPVELPESYIKLLKRTFNDNYNYGKLAASDELGKKAPMTKKAEAEHLERYLDFVTERQVADLESFVLQAKMNLSVSEDDTLAHKIMRLASNWVSQVASGTGAGVVAQAMSNGRSDAFDSLDVDLYQWSAVLENTCPTCLALDGKIVTREQRDESIFNPPVHLNCRCIWVGIKEGDGDYELPEPTGIPDGIDDLDMVQRTNRAELEAMGIVEPDQTKKSVVDKMAHNTVDDGSTLKDVENNIRNNTIEHLGAFDASGTKIVNIIGDESSVELAPHWEFLRDNNVSIMTHNHPRSTSFSGDDLSVAQGLNVDEMRVVSQYYEYSLKPGKDGWPSDDLKEIYEAVSEEQYLIAMQGALSPKSELYGKTKEDLEWWYINETVSSIADQFMLKYTYRRLK